MLKKIRALDMFTKAGIILLIMMILYILLLFLLRPIFIHSDTPLAHATVMGDHIMNFVSPEQSSLNIAALFLAVVGGLSCWLLIRGEREKNTTGISASEKKNELDILKRALSADEKKIIAEIEKAGEITQDSLRFRLNWSKAKVSAILLQLDRMNIVQRERQGKTYSVFLSKKKKEDSV